MTISNDQTTIAIGTYTTQRGFSVCDNQPQEAINAGGKWRVYGQQHGRGAGYLRQGSLRVNKWWSSGV